VIRSVAQEVKKKHSNVACVGFCYGSKPVVEVQKSGDVNAIVCFHPSFCTPEDAVALKGKGPSLWQVPETDERFPPELCAVYQKELGGQPGVKFNLYKGCTHGFGSRRQFALTEGVEGVHE
jgi:dienelactone hydrolase